MRPRTANQTHPAPTWPATLPSHQLDRTPEPPHSFAIVIQQLPNPLRDSICVFYLVLRGLDTVEDDMALDVDFKLPELRRFHERIYDRWERKFETLLFLGNVWPRGPPGAARLSVSRVEPQACAAQLRCAQLRLSPVSPFHSRCDAKRPASFTAC